jgi:hypothetical protein
MPVNKGVENAASGRSGGAPVSSSETPGSPAMMASPAEAEAESARVRRRNHRHHRHQSLNTRSGKAKEIAFVTLFAIAILFAILYYLLPHYQAQNPGEDSLLNPVRRGSTRQGCATRVEGDRRSV